MMWAVLAGLATCVTALVTVTSSMAWGSLAALLALLVYRRHLGALVGAVLAPLVISLNQLTFAIAVAPATRLSMGYVYSAFASALSILTLAGTGLPRFLSRRWSPLVAVVGLGAACYAIFSTHVLAAAPAVDTAVAAMTVFVIGLLLRRFGPAVIAAVWLATLLAPSLGPADNTLVLSRYAGTPFDTVAITFPSPSDSYPTVFWDNELVTRDAHGDLLRLVPDESGRRMTAELRPLLAGSSLAPGAHEIVVVVADQRLRAAFQIVAPLSPAGAKVDRLGDGWQVSVSGGHEIGLRLASGSELSAAQPGPVSFLVAAQALPATLYFGSADGYASVALPRP